MTTHNGSDGPDWADHRLVIEAADSPEPVTYHVITSGRIESPQETDPPRTGGVFGHASATLATTTHEYRYSGRVISMRIRPSLVTLGLRDYREAPFEVRIDGTPTDFERWDPSRGDLPFGYGGSGALPADVAIGPDDCDRIVSTRDELQTATETLGDGEVLGIDADISLPAEPEAPIAFSQDDCALVGVPTESGAAPILSLDRTPAGGGHVGVQLGGDRAVVMNLQFRGPLTRFVPYDEYDGRVCGLAMTGEYPVAINCHGWHWPHAAFSARGAGETFLCIDAHHNMLGGLGYGFSSSGPVSLKDWEVGETWSEDELDTYRPWHRRTEIKRVVMDANRHDVAGHRNTSYELRWFVTGPTAVTGHRIDVHRPGGGIATIADGVVEESIQGETDDGEHGVMIRGWPAIAARVENVWFPWGTEPDPAARYPGGPAPIVQTCATAETRNRRRVWDTSNDPFIRVAWPDCTFGPDAPDTIRDELRDARSRLDERWTADSP